jgi:hypothetical protein
MNQLNKSRFFSFATLMTGTLLASSLAKAEICVSHCDDDCGQGVRITRCVDNTRFDVRERKATLRSESSKREILEHLTNRLRLTGLELVTRTWDYGLTVFADRASHENASLCVLIRDQRRRSTGKRTILDCGDGAEIEIKGWVSRYLEKQGYEQVFDDVGVFRTEDPTDGWSTSIAVSVYRRPQRCQMN